MEEKDRQTDWQTYRQTKNCFKRYFTDLFRYYSSTLTEMARWAKGRNGTDQKEPVLNMTLLSYYTFIQAHR